MPYTAEVTSSGGDQTAEIQSKLASLTGGGELTIHGPVRVSQITPPNRVSIVGTNTFTDRILGSDPALDIFNLANVYGVKISNLQIESQIARTGGAAVRLFDSDNCTLERLRLIDTYNLLEIDSCGKTILTDVKAEWGGKVINRGVHIIRSTSTHARDCMFDGGALNLPAGNAWWMIDSQNDTITLDQIEAGCPATGSGTGLRIYHSLAPGSFAPRLHRYNNCWFEGSSGGKGLAGQPAVIIDAAYYSCQFTDLYTATSAVAGVIVNAGTDIRFRGRDMLNSFGPGMIVNGGDVTMTEMVFNSNSQELDGLHAHLKVNGGSARVRDSYFGNKGLARTAQPGWAVENNASCRLDDCEIEYKSLRKGLFTGTKPVEQHNLRLLGV